MWGFMFTFLGLAAQSRRPEMGSFSFDKPLPLVLIAALMAGMLLIVTAFFSTEADLAFVSVRPLAVLIIQAAWLLLGLACIYAVFNTLRRRKNKIT